MANGNPNPENRLSAIAVPPPSQAQTDGLVITAATEALTDQAERRLDEIEMIGEEEAAGFRPAAASDISPGLRYLHASRTIHQLVTDRNRAVGIYLAVASLLWTASTALLNAPKPNAALIVPIETIQRWCLPATFGTLAVLALFVGFLLIRTRIGLIYEVAKMNVLLGLPVGRVKRVNPLSIFFIMHALIALAGGASAAMFAFHLLVLGGAGQPLAWSSLIGLVVTMVLIGSYIFMVLSTTSDAKLDGGVRGP
jgi:hypothetical protein